MLNNINTAPTLRSYEQMLNNINTVPTLRSYEQILNNINTGPTLRSYGKISYTGDDPFLYYFPYPCEFFDNYITNITNLYKYNVETYYLHKK